jgi:hypothetical protein
MAATILRPGHRLRYKETDMRLFKTCALMALLAVGAMAAPIDFTYTGSGSGTLNGIAFGVSNFSFTGTYDTEYIFRPPNNAYAAPLDFASITIDGVGSFTITTFLYLYVNNNTMRVGLTTGFGDVYRSVAPVFGTWVLDSAIGPVNGSGELLFQHNNQQLMTTGGVLIFDDATPTSTFTATLAGSATPEPTSFALAGLGLFAAGLLRRRARRLVAKLECK